ncbi:hypothetical protein SERLA73DRAFT_184394 [Serpula lacrymans var. lacrymans S7.3]|uniref:Uncharacterized protein n=1 Tax=Serpula lacrymans var. lacrymans (strain S7.3) TaxID=936435 RepID=F8Q353_SERL3|nr:hypothetical protein SERLA73DRAFT_184394 [Serpula lacrymans var. lacrymans S7.3]
MPRHKFDGRLHFGKLWALHNFASLETVEYVTCTRQKKREMIIYSVDWYWCRT